MLRITQNQMEMFENHALTRTEFDIADALLRHFDSGKRIAAAINFSIMESADRVASAIMHNLTSAEKAGH